jgi:8-amino-7-oxononanoate synthase
LASASRERLRDHLDRLRQTHRYRQRRTVEARQGVLYQVAGRELVNFCSNDYLGLAQDPALLTAAAESLHRFGLGSGAAHLISGHSREHADLEAELADFLGCQRALLFSTGYMANLGAISALLGRHDQLFEDRLNHASLVDAAQLARVRCRRYPHLDWRALERSLQQAPSAVRLVATDSVFSMDGDRAPLTELADLCERHQAYLLADEAHALGVIGPDGRGALAEAGLRPTGGTLMMGTLGKALGTFGAFLTGDAELIETLLQRARPFIYTTASPPALAAATRVALRLIREQAWRRDRLAELVARFRRSAADLGLSLLPSDTPIQPLLLGSEARALSWSERLWQAGLWVGAIRPPTVPEGSARLRVTFSATHTDEQLEQLLRALAELVADEA